MYRTILGENNNTGSVRLPCKIYFIIKIKSIRGNKINECEERNSKGKVHKTWWKFFNKGISRGKRKSIDIRDRAKKVRVKPTTLALSTVLGITPIVLSHALLCGYRMWDIVRRMARPRPISARSPLPRRNISLRPKHLHLHDGGPASASRFQNGGPASASASRFQNGGPASASASRFQNGGPASASASRFQNGGPASASASRFQNGGPASRIAISRESRYKINNLSVSVRIEVVE